MLLRSLTRSSWAPGCKLVSPRGFRYLALWVTLGWTFVFLIIVGSLLPTPTDSAVLHYDKVNHLLIYALLMGWFTQFLTRRTVQLRYMLAFILLGIIMEFLQALTAYRLFEVADMAANAVGVFAGWIVSTMVMPGWLLKLDHLMSATK